MANLIPGTLVWRDDVHLGLVKHFGIVLQGFPCYVAHIDKASTGHLRVKVETLEAFAQGRQVTYEPLAQPVSLATMWTRVNEVTRKQYRFGLMTWGEDWNCESFARFVKDGIARSEQASKANGVLAFAAASAGLLWLANAFSETKWDSDAQRYRDRSSGRFTAG